MTPRSSLSETPMAFESEAEWLVRKIRENLHQIAPVAAPPNVPAIRLERRMEAAQSIRTRDNVAHSRVNHHQLLSGYWNILTFTGKELDLIEEAKRYHLDIIRVSSTKRRSSGTVDVDGGRKLFYSRADPSMSAQAGVGIITSPVCQTVCQIGFLWDHGSVC